MKFYSYFDKKKPIFVGGGGAVQFYLFYILQRGINSFIPFFRGVHPLQGGGGGGSTFPGVQRLISI